MARGSEATRVSTTHAFTTTVASVDGSFGAEIVSFPHFFDQAQARTSLDLLVDELNLGRGAAVTDETLEPLLEQIAFESRAARGAGVENVREVVQAVVHDPIVVTEESPAVGSTLLGLVSQAPPTYILMVEGRPFLALAYEGAFVAVWFLAAPVIGAREGLREGAREATRAVSSELFEGWLRRRFRRRRQRE